MPTKEETAALKKQANELESNLDKLMINKVGLRPRSFEGPRVVCS